ncbi:MAG TPA: diacylglycerol kinase family protein [Gemmatimonadaceae bacterium]|nr:diacylglycerol kinase family protein [Gemmatimonadaceae bacterium]
MTRDVCVIVNPASGRGLGARTLPAVGDAFARVGVTDVRVSETQYGEKTLARRAIEEGKSTLVAVGGDGTWSNVANTILESGADVRLGLVAAGTGNDFYKTVGAPARDLSATARLVADGTEVRVDVGRIEHKYFLNVAGFGFDIAVLEDIREIGWLRGRALYFYSALRQLLGYRGVDIGIGSHRARRDARHLMLIVANARHFGGSFRIAPQASLVDGLLDAISIHDAPAMRRMQLFSAAMRGTHVAHPEVVAEQAERFHLTFAAPPAYETDGEYNVAASSELDVFCVPRRLRIAALGERAALQ